MYIANPDACYPFYAFYAGRASNQVLIPVASVLGKLMLF